MRILITPLLQGKPWNGATVYSEGLGGSESAVVYMARALYQQGAKVTVVCAGQPGSFDGVRYEHVSELGKLIQHEWDVVISSRWVDVLNQPLSAGVRVLWVHDVPQGAMQIAADYVFTISEFQTRLYGIPPQHSFVTRNGFDPAAFYFDPLRDRDQNMLVWASNPDRGLPIAARIFQEIRKRWPSLELHVYGRSAVYGWGNDVEAPFLPREADMTNVYLHAPLPRPKLGHIFRKAWALFYPTFWPETSCMTAIEAQACGLPIITAPVGALPETVKGGILGYDYLNAVSQLRNYGRWRTLSQEGLAHVRGRYEWRTIASEWLTLFDDRLRGQPVSPGGAVPGDAGDRAPDVVPEVVRQEM